MPDTRHNQNRRVIAKLIEEVVERMDVQADEYRLSSLLAYSIGRVLLKEANYRGETLDVVQVESRYVHIADWLLSAIRTGAPWLQNIDERGRPKKLMKFSSVDGIVGEADKAMRKFAQKQRSIKLEEGHEELAMELPDGWYVARLLTPAALDRESGEMQHCIGQGAYDARLEDPRYAFFSLRDPSGKAHATLEADMEKKSILQFQGKQNAEPRLEYIDRVLPFMRMFGIRPTQLSPSSIWVFDTDYNRHDFRKLPEGVILNGPLEIRDQMKLTLPRDMTVIGSLSIKYCDVLRMPERLSVTGSYSVKRSILKTVPGNLALGGGVVNFLEVDEARVADTVEHVGKLVFLDCETAHVPKGLDGRKSHLRFERCRGYSGTENLVGVNVLEIVSCDEMPMTTVEFTSRSLTVIKTPCQVFSSQVKFEGDVTIRECGLAYLPDGLEVGGSLDISRNPVKAIPPSVRIGGELNISRTHITVIPPELGSLKSLDASNSHLTSLDGVVVEGDINVSSTEITHIPHGFCVGGNLIASNMSLVRIGDGVRVGGRLTISRTNVEYLPDDIFVGAGLDASYSSLRGLSADFATTGDLRLEGSDLYRLPAGLVVKGNLDISMTNVSEFPMGVVIEGNLVCKNGFLKTVADDTVVLGYVLHPAGNAIFPQSPEGLVFKAATQPPLRQGPTP